VTRKEGEEYAEGLEVKFIFEEAQERRGMPVRFDDPDAGGFWGITVRAYEEG